ncbi:hypothetical protein GQ600_24740 [Phytophthora cactorum]|nr:hypothetical protein GQ600_24740 [Phytophthora cactorum]
MNCGPEPKLHKSSVGAWKPEFQCIIVESMITYLDRNVSGGAEVATLRKQGQGDLMALLLSIIDAEDAIKTMKLRAFRCFACDCTIQSSSFRWIMRDMLYVKALVNCVGTFEKLHQDKTHW